MKCFGKGFGWICALNRWSVFALKLFRCLCIYFWVQANSCLNSQQIDTLFLVWGVRKGGFRGGCSFWAGGPNFTRKSKLFVLRHLIRANLIHTRMQISVVHIRRQSEMAPLITVL